MSRAVKIPLSQGKFALVDEADAERVNAFKWSAAWMRYDWRAVCNRGGKTIYLHRFVLDAPEGLQVDHINGDGLDNRRANLRLATSQQNNRNTYRVKAGQFKGVRPAGRRFIARIKLRGRLVSIGSFGTAEDAARAYDAQAAANFGEFARLNFPGTPAPDRTGNLQLRRLTLYPIELRAHGFKHTTAQKEGVAK